MRLMFEADERELILRYGFPTGPIKSALEAGRRISSASRFDVERLVGELSRSINHGEVPNEWLDLGDALCEHLEYELRAQKPEGSK